jgi:hypothetical protein
MHLLTIDPSLARVWLAKFTMPQRTLGHNLQHKRVIWPKLLHAKSKFGQKSNSSSRGNLYLTKCPQEIEDFASLLAC